MKECLSKKKKVIRSKLVQNKHDHCLKHHWRGCDRVRADKASRLLRRGARELRNELLGAGTRF